MTVLFNNIHASEIVVTKCLYVLFLHYENRPMQYAGIFKAVKKKIFSRQFLIVFLIFAQNRDCGYTLEPPRRGGSNEYPQSMF